jgi:hypothetical protein
VSPQDLDYHAEFERRQFELYEARRIAEETQASAVVAAAIVAAGLVLTDYVRKSDPDWFVVAVVVALVGCLWAFALATAARVVSWETPPWLGGPYPENWKPSGVLQWIAWGVFRMPLRVLLMIALGRFQDVASTLGRLDKESPDKESRDKNRPDARVGKTLDVVRDLRDRNHVCLLSRVADHWCERQQSALKLGDRKEAHLRRSLWGFLGLLCYIALRVITST